MPIIYTFGKNNVILDYILKSIGNTCKIEDHLYLTTLFNKYCLDDLKIIQILSTNDTILIHFENGEILLNKFISFITPPQRIDITLSNNNKIDFISCGYNHYIFKSSNNLIYGLGDNKYNQLGILNEKEILKNSNDNNDNGYSWFNSIQLIKYFNNIDIKYVSCGKNHSIFVDSNGKVYSCGSNEYGQLGLSGTDSDDINIYEINQIHSINDEIIVKCSSGYFHNLLLTDQGKVYSFGLNSYGQLGLDCNDNFNENIPKLISSISNTIIVDSKCSNCHSILLTIDNKVFTFGKGTNYQLGHGDDESSLIPLLVDDLSEFKIKSINCSSISSIFLDNKNRLFYTGGYLNTNQFLNDNSNNNNFIYHSSPKPISQIIHNNINLNKFNNIYTNNLNKTFIW